VLAKSSNDGQLLAVLSQSVELVGKCGLELLAGDVGQLCFGDKRFGFSTNKLLLEDDDLGGVRLLVFELRDLIGDLLLTYGTVSKVYVEMRGWGSIRSRLGCTDASMLRMLFIVTRYWS
jgi:hypothetical protein